MNANPPVHQVAIAVIVDRGRVLVGPRPAEAPWSGYWEFPGGHVEEGESIAQAVVRETLEETGLTVQAGKLLAGATITTSRGELLLSFLDCTPIQSIEPTPPFRWVELQRLRELPFPPANAAVLEILAPS